MITRDWNDSIPKTGRALIISDGVRTCTTRLAFDDSIDDVIADFGYTYDFNAASAPVKISLSVRYYMDAVELGAKDYTITNVCPECGALYESSAAAHEATCVLTKLVNDLWWFIENATDDMPDRTERFFALRERVRVSGGHA